MLLPPLSKEIMERMSRDGYQCYLVGGSVRDLLMCRQPADYDFVTDRKPEQIVAAAIEAGWKVQEYGESFGVFSIIIDNEKYEIAVMRTEAYGKDPHRPESVAFVDDICKDLARRDFTMNGIAMDKDGKLIDPFGGIDDIQRGVIRCIGKAKARFLEDPLRVLRVSRFMATTGFCLETSIPPAMLDENVQRRFRDLSVERVRDEFEKILVSPLAGQGLRLLVDTGVLGLSCSVKQGGRKTSRPFLPELAELKGVSQNPRFHRFDVLTHVLRTVDKVSPDLTLRWAALLHDIAKGKPGVRTVNSRGELSDYGHHLKGAELAKKILARLKVSSGRARRVVWLVKNHQNLPDPTPQKLIRWSIKKAGDFTERDELIEAIHQLFLLGRADDAAKGRARNRHYFDSLAFLFPKIAEEMVFYPRELQISGEAVVDKVGGGPVVGKILKDLLLEVQAGRIENTPEDLEAALDKKVKHLSGKRKKT